MADARVHCTLIIYLHLWKFRQAFKSLQMKEFFFFVSGGALVSALAS